MTLRSFDAPRPQRLTGTYEFLGGDAPLAWSPGAMTLFLVLKDNCESCADVLSAPSFSDERFTMLRITHDPAFASPSTSVWHAPEVLRTLNVASGPYALLVNQAGAVVYEGALFSLAQILTEIEAHLSE